MRRSPSSDIPFSVADRPEATKRLPQPAVRSSDMRIARSSHRTKLLGIGTAVPQHRCEQREIARFLRNVAAAQEGAPSGFLRRVDSIAEGSGIDARYTVL